MRSPSRGWLASVARTTRKWLGLPVHDAAGRGRRSLAWSPGNPGAVAAMLATQTELRAKSRDIARHNAWANAALESFVSNAIGTGIKPQSMVADQALREAIHRLWTAWVAEGDAAGLTDSGTLTYGKVNIDRTNTGRILKEISSIRRRRRAYISWHTAQATAALRRDAGVFLDVHVSIECRGFRQVRIRGTLRKKRLSAGRPAVSQASCR